MFWKFVIFCIKLVSEWPILLPGNGQNAGFYTIYPRASGAFSGPPAIGHLAIEVAGTLRT
jgi:hypothetical protein